MRTPHFVPLLVFVAAGALAGCDPQGPTVRFPPGDPAHGREVFVALQCHSCHSVDGEPALPAPVAQPPVDVVLGGSRVMVPSLNALAAAIATPERTKGRAAPLPLRGADGMSRMPDFSASLSVRDLGDLTAYVHGRYRQSPRVGRFVR